jgi:hypothetical protein
MYKFSLFFCLLFGSSIFAANPDTLKNNARFQFYLSWGYNRDWFSPSDLHFNNADKGHDFVVMDVKAKDRSGFSQIIPLAKKLDFSIPQYNYRIGIFSKNKPNWGLEISFDHTKYVMVDNQTLRVKGRLSGNEVDTTMFISATQFLHFEHTNGANFLMINLMRKISLLTFRNHQLLLLAKAGAGVVIPKTYVRFLGEELDNKFHVAGYLAGLESTLRYQFHRVFIDFSAKGVFANYSNVLVLPGTKAKHHFWCFEAIATVGAVIGRKQ